MSSIRWKQTRLLVFWPRLKADLADYLTTNFHVPHSFCKNMNDGMSQSDRTTQNYHKNLFSLFYP